ncbi:MAG: carbohydrate ABC transporter permease [Micromonosporaceae bacterium]
MAKLESSRAPAPAPKRRRGGGQATTSRRRSGAGKLTARAVTRRRPAGGARLATRGATAPWRYAVPALAFYGLVLLYPSVSGAGYAFTDWNGLAAPDFVGMANFQRMFDDPQAYASIANTLLLTVAVTVAQNAIGLALAVGLNTSIASRNLLRVVFFAPAVLSPLILAYLWQYLYASDGAVNRLLSGVGLGGLTQDWLGDPDLALWSIAVCVVWQNVGLSMVIYLAALQGVPRELHEAASIDGAGAWRRFAHITWPLIAPATTIATVLSVIGCLKLFDQIMAITGGGPGHATETAATVIYKKAFVYGQFGYSTALALVLTAVIFLVSVVHVVLLRRREAFR